MKVMCIDDSNPNQIINYPSISEVVTVLRKCDTDKDSWVISEYQFAKDGNPQSLHKDRFIPLSSIDETEMLRERELTHA